MKFKAFCGKGVGRQFGINLNNELYYFKKVKNENKYYNFKRIFPNKLFKDISSGGFHSLFIDENNQLYGIGSNGQNQLSYSNIKSYDYLKEFKEFNKCHFIKCKFNSSMIINDGVPYYFGKDPFEIFKNGLKNINNIIDLEFFEYGCIFINNNGECYTFALNKITPLFLNSDTNINPTPEKVILNFKPKKIIYKNDTIYILDTDGIIHISNQQILSTKKFKKISYNFALSENNEIYHFDEMTKINTELEIDDLLTGINHQNLYIKDKNGEIYHLDVDESKFDKTEMVIRYFI